MYTGNLQKDSSGIALSLSKQLDSKDYQLLQAGYKVYSETREANEINVLREGSPSFTPKCSRLVSLTYEFIYQPDPELLISVFLATIIDQITQKLDIPDKYLKLASKINSTDNLQGVSTLIPYIILLDDLRHNHLERRAPASKKLFLARLVSLNQKYPELLSEHPKLKAKLNFALNRYCLS